MRGTQFAELSAFVAVAELRSFSKAATQLGISSSTLSQSIRALEESLGTRLLNRTTRSVAATEVGEQLLARLRPILDDYDAALESINAFRDKPAGRLRISVAPPVARFVLPPIVPRFLAEYPSVELEISDDVALTDIVAAGFDAGIRIGERLERDMVAIRVTGEMREVVVASPDYLARHPEPKAPRDLHSHNCIRQRLPSGAFIPWRFRVDGRVMEVAVAGSFVVNNTDLAIRAALEGTGLFCTPEEYVAPMIDDGRLVSLLEDCAPPRFAGFFLYYPSRRQMPGALRAFIDFMRANVRLGASTQEDVRAQSEDSSKEARPEQ